MQTMTTEYAAKADKTAKLVTPNTLYLSDIQLAERLALHRTTIWRRARTEPGFPKPVRLSPSCARWRRADVEAWEASLT